MLTNASQYSTHNPAQTFSYEEKLQSGLVAQYRQVDLCEFHDSQNYRESCLKKIKYAGRAGEMAQPSKAMLTTKIKKNTVLVLQ